MNYISNTKETSTDYEVPATSGSIESDITSKGVSVFGLTRYLLLGAFFGILLIKSEVTSWFRIQEMFRFQSFHMYGVIGSAIAVALPMVWWLRSKKIKAADGSEIKVINQKPHKGNWIGGLIFGIGWALTGACPGPLFALAGSGAWIIWVPIASALAGTWVYGLLREKLPH